jgi:hypothetical protein
MSLVSDVHDILVNRNYQWKINGTLVTPDIFDVEDAFARIKERLTDEPVGTALEVGRLRVQKTDDGLETYIYIGDLP